MKRYTIALLSSVLVASIAFASEEITSEEIAILTCIERTTQFDGDNSSKEKADLANAIFKKANLDRVYNHARHANARDRKDNGSPDTYLKCYSLCDEYIYEVDPDGSKYNNYD